MLKQVSFDQLAGTTMGKYLLERFIGQSKLGPTFLARSDAASTCLVRFLAQPLHTAPGDRQVYLEHFRYRAGQIAALQHPNILPLLDFGIFHGFPYLVSPHIPLRSLRTRIEKNGALNTFTVGRYLDQIATALEYAHEHAVLHGSLSVDSIFIRLDGQLVVADVGMRGLLELNTHDTSGQRLSEWSEGRAPEQLLGKPASPATDVYALGAVIFQLLTGSPVFDGHTPDEIAQQHLYSSLPPLTEWRSDLPTALYAVLVRALAKDPTQRFHQPGAFANAYHNALGLANRTRLPFVVASGAAGTSGYSLHGTDAPLAGPQLGERAGRTNGSALAEQVDGSARPMSPASLRQSMHGFSDDTSLSLIDGPRPGLLRRFGRKGRRRSTLVIALAVLLVFASSAVGITVFAQRGSAAGASGQVTFFASQDDPTGQTNSLRITVQHLAAPAANDTYQAWILNDQSEQVLALGRLAEKGQTWSLTLSGASSNLLEAGDTLEVTQEQGVAGAPAGQVILSGTFPRQAFQHIQHLLVSFPPTPGKIALLVGMLQQTHLLDSQATLLQSIATNGNASTVACLAQSMLDLIEGAHGAHYQPLAGSCARQSGVASGDGYGLLGKGFIAGAEQHAALALRQPDATSVMHQHAALMDIALTNISGWLATIEQDLLHLEAHPSDLSPLGEISTLADAAYHGVDANGDGQIDAVAGEAGALTAYVQGQLMATLTLTPGA